MTLKLHNTLTRTREEFRPIDKERVTLYACGPTVYDRPHLGNARAVVVYDTLFRILRLKYDEKDVIYARNITDVDDKIITAAKERGITINELTTEVTAAFHHDMAALNCLPPTHEPRATQYIAQMIAMIETLIDNGAAYEAQGHVLFSVESNASYGKLSGRKLDDLIAGARVEVADYKQHPGDFVLWKPADADEESAFDSPWGRGRPGWHIECSAMSTDLLGETFDIHGGGADLKFPHHENEIAQSCGANPKSEFAKMWVHNGFLTIDGEKMSKSLGNFTTVHDLLEKGTHGETIRLAFLMTKYNEPLDWNEKLLSDAKKTLNGWYRKLQSETVKDVVPPQAFIGALYEDMNLPLAISQMHKADASQLKAMAEVIGLLQQDANAWFKGEASDGDAAIQAQIDARIAAKKAKDFETSDRIRKELEDAGIILEDKRDGTTDWRRG